MISVHERGFRNSLLLADILSLWLAIFTVLLLADQSRAWLVSLHLSGLSTVALAAGLTVLWCAMPRDAEGCLTQLTLSERIWQALRSSVLFTTFITAIAFLTRTLFSRSSLLLFIPLAALFCSLLRSVLPSVLLRVMRPSGVNVLVLGQGVAAKRLEAHLKSKAAFRVARADFGRKSSLPSLLELLERSRPHELLIACRCPSEVLIDILNLCRAQAISWQFIPSRSQKVLGNTVSRLVAGLPLVAERTTAVHGANLLLKRALDVSLASLILALCSPAMIGIWIAIRLSSPGPAIFRQERVGYKGQPFRMYKFRTMFVNSNDSLHRQYAKRWILDGPNAANREGFFKLSDDKRITRLGYWLRRYSLDELPQLLNVLKCEMSLVGPRPPLPYEVETYKPVHMQRLYAPPGMTGLWQVCGRHALSFERMVELDLEYVQCWSLRRDIFILFRTIPAVIFGTGH
ncbi:MAG: sugar transferase [Candidatus Korobacteraceae bacterium]